MSNTICWYMWGVISKVYSSILNVQYVLKSITITFDVIVIYYNYFRNCNLIVIEYWNQKVIVIVTWPKNGKVIVIVIYFTDKSIFNYISITFQFIFKTFFKIIISNILLIKNERF